MSKRTKEARSFSAHPILWTIITGVFSGIITSIVIGVFTMIAFPKVSTPVLTTESAPSPKNETTVEIREDKEELDAKIEELQSQGIDYAHALKIVYQEKFFKDHPFITYCIMIIGSLVLAGTISVSAVFLVRRKRYRLLFILFGISIGVVGILYFGYSILYKI
ncbi:MAG: hypothetical protein HFG41_10200 [Coprococcus sp.]|nr:hypothetical protein [Coprococcus sp.]